MTPGLLMLWALAVLVCVVVVVAIITIIGTTVGNYRKRHAEQPVAKRSPTVIIGKDDRGH